MKTDFQIGDWVITEVGENVGLVIAIILLPIGTVYTVSLPEPGSGLPIQKDFYALELRPISKDSFGFNIKE